MTAPSKFRWYRVHLPKASGSLGSLLIKHPFTVDQGQGFLKHSNHFGEPIYRFAWASSMIVTELDSNGEESTREVKTINFTNFSVLIAESSFFIRIENPGRSVRALLNAIESIVGLGFRCTPITFDKHFPLNIFNTLGSIKLVGIKISDLPLEKGLVAKMELSSSEGIATEKIINLNGKHYKTDFASYEIVHQGLKGNLSYSSNGVVKTSGPLTPKLISLLEGELPSLVST